VRVRNILPRGAVIALVGLIVCTSAAQAETIELSPGVVKLLRFDRTVGTVAVGNPAVADTFAPNDRAVLITGKTIGSTNLIVLDDGGRDLYSADIVISRSQFGRVSIHSKGLLHRYWAYQCSDASCWRLRDEFEGPMPEQTQQRIEQDSTTRGGPAEQVPTPPEPVAPR
jgi:membrane-associated protease RseP (regulator of RpoE activity)